ncbi:MAG: hypothetical protein JKY71_02880 [Alphaproteobacteria bacterium]|nr:hypothetical protein [Alphaproteobacteria bacterium]
MAKKHNKGKISKRQQAQNKRAGLLEVWTDGSYLDGEGVAGGAAIICNADGKLQSTMSFEFNHLPMPVSDFAELWAAAKTLNALKPGSVGRLTTDCPAVKGAIMDIRNGKGMNEAYPQNLRDSLMSGVAAHPHMAVDKVTRGQGKIPLADQFAKAAARGDMARIEAVIRSAGNKPHTHEPSRPESDL